MSLLVPWFLVGLPLAAIPILLHLLNKPRYQREPWGAMLFLEEAVQTRSRSIQLQEWLLMVLRTLAVLLLVLAMTRPVLSGRQSGGRDLPTTHVLVMDASYSMQRGGEDEALFEEAREVALELVEDMGPQDNMLIVRAGARPEALFPRPVFDKAYLKGQLEQLEPGPEESNLPAALEQSAWLLGFSTLPNHRIVVLDDGQRNAWNSEQEEDWKRVELQLEELPNPPSLYSIRFAPNEEGTHLAVTGLRAKTPLPDVFRPVEFEVEIRNDGAVPVTRSVRFEVDGRRRDAQDVSLEPGPNAVRFEHRFREAGSHRVLVDLGGDDLPVDNQATLALDVLERIPVLIIEGTTEESRIKSDGGLMELALQAGRTPDGGALFEVERISHLEMEDKRLRDLLAYKTIVMANVPALSSRFGALIERYLEAGGGLLIGLGPELSADSYNRWTTDADGWVPVQLGEWVNDLEEPLTPTFPAGRAAEVLDVFDLSRTRQLDAVQVREYFKVESLGEGIEAGQLGEDLFLWVQDVHEGTVGVWTTTFTPAHSNFPAVPDFVPLVQNLVMRLAGGAIPPVNLRQEETLVVSVELESLPGDAEFATVLSPDGEENKVALEPVRRTGVLEWTETRTPGLYEVQVPGQPPRYVSVSIPHAEGELTGLEPDLETGIQEQVMVRFTDGLEALRREMERETGVRDLWRILLLVALAVLVAEGILAWRFSQ